MSSVYGPPYKAKQSTAISGQKQNLYLDWKAFYLAIDQPKPEGDNCYRDINYSGFHKNRT